MRALPVGSCGRGTPTGSPAAASTTTGKVPPVWSALASPAGPDAEILAAQDDTRLDDARKRHPLDFALGAA